MELSESIALLKQTASTNQPNNEQNSSVETAKQEAEITRSAALNLSVPGAAVFIIGKVVGLGILLLPNALSDTGPFGIIIAVLCLIGTTYTGIRLGQCWNILTELNDKYRTEIYRNPYGEIAYEAFGKKGKLWTTAFIYIYIIALCVTDLLVIADNTSIVFSKIDIQVSVCICLPIVTLIICPLTWFGTPKDFRFVGITASLTALLASILVVIGTSLDVWKHKDEGDVSVQFWTFAGAFGLIGFSFAGQSVFPTLQHDMKHPTKFVTSVLYGYAGIAMLYFPVSIFAMWVYRAMFIETGVENIAYVFSSSGITVAVVSTINIHLILAVVIFTNTLYQDLEQVLNVPYDFNWKRCVIRTTFMLLAFGIAFTVPNFKTFLSIFGGPLTAIVNFLLPLGLYTKLCSNPVVSVKLTTTIVVINISVMALSVITGTLSTVSAIYNIINMNGTIITKPCYIDM